MSRREELIALATALAREAPSSRSLGTSCGVLIAETAIAALDRIDREIGSTGEVVPQEQKGVPTP